VHPVSIASLQSDNGGNQADVSCLNQGGNQADVSCLSHGGDQADVSSLSHGLALSNPEIDALSAVSFSRLSVSPSRLPSEGLAIAHHAIMHSCSAIECALLQ